MPCPLADVWLTPDSFRPNAIHEHTAIVVDVLRATSTIATALAHGCRGVAPFATIEEVEALAEEWNRPEPLFRCGERGGAMIPGFDRGNSPREFRELPHDAYLAMTSTNGTRAILACRDAAAVYTGSLLNRRAIAEAAASLGRPITIALSGTLGQYSLDDALGAGALIEALEPEGVTDAAKSCLHLFERFRGRLEEGLRESLHGQKLIRWGFGEDLPFCAQLDQYDVVPEYRDGWIRALHEII